MELAYITIRFDSPEEQKFVEDNISNLVVYEHETWSEESGYKSWTEFDISGCEPHDVQEALEEVMNKWEENQND